jgi:tetratricopeptide (TPR) repeat protein
MKFVTLLTIGLVILSVCPAWSQQPANAQVDLGQRLNGEKRYAEALEVFEEVLRKAPRDFSALYGAALAAFNLEKLPQAETLAHSAIAVALASGRKNLSRKQATRAADAFVLLAIVLAVKGDEDNSLRAAEQAVAISRDHFDAQFTLGRALYSSGDASRAAAAFRAALALNPDDGRAIFFLGTALEASGDVAGALKTFRELISKHPELAEGYLGAGSLLLKGDGSSVEGITNLERAIAINPNLYEARVNLGKALLAQGLASESLEHLNRAAELAPGNPEPHYQLSIAYRRLGMKEKAEQESEFVKQIHEARRTPRTP